MKMKELRQKTDKELKGLLDEYKLKIGRFKFDLSSKKVKNVKQFGGFRRDIARILTILKER